MSQDREPELDFKVVAICENPMEAELYPAALREKEIIHRTRWSVEGRLVLEVPAEWLAEAQAILNEAARVFFHAPGVRPPDPALATPLQGPGRPPTVPTPGRAGFLRGRLLAALVPGLGLGFMYARQLDLFLAMLALSSAGWVITLVSRVPWGLVLNALAWAYDITMAIREKPTGDKT